MNRSNNIFNKNEIENKIKDFKEGQDYSVSPTDEPNIKTYNFYYMKSTNKQEPKNFSFPPEEEIKKLLKRVEQPNYRRTNIGLHPNATPAEKAKYKLCKTIARYERENKLSEQELGKKLGIDQAKTEYILFCHLDKLHLDELINYADNLHLPFKLTINGLHANQKTTAEAY